MDSEYTFQSLQGKKVLIIGDVGTGKTTLTLKLLEEAIRTGFGNRITVIDMAPAIVEAKGMRVGGKLLGLSDQLKETKYLTPIGVETPRLKAKSAKELLYLVNLNEKQIGPLLKKYIKNPTPILFINDISIYLQSGVDEHISSAIRAAETFIANGYYGEAFKEDFGTGVTNRERRLMRKIIENVDVLIEL